MMVRRSIVWGTATLAALAFAQPAIAAAGDAKPKGPRCTIVGSNDADILRGTREADVICGKAGADRIRGGDGDDVLNGGGGRDKVLARAGNDNLKGGGGDDRLYGQVDDDVIAGGAGADILDGGEGNNRCPGSDAQDRIDTTCWMGYRIDWVSISPPAVDTWLADREVSVAIHVTDTWREESGGSSSALESIGVDTHSPLGAAPTGSPPRGVHGLALVDGDAAEGVWAGSVVLRRYYATGAHPISLVFRERRISSSGYAIPFEWFVSADRLIAAGHDSSIDQLGPGDPGPNLLALEISPRTTRATSAEVTVTASSHWHHIDDVTIRFEDESTYPGPRAHERRETFESTWSGYADWPSHSPAGTYRVTEVSISSGSARRTYDTAELERLGFDPSVHYTGP
jgi:Ca2+-binding RTX toxin-like protein